MDAPAGCPTEQVLQDFVAGELHESQARPIREHLASCASCRDALGRLQPEIKAPDSDEAAEPQTILQATAEDERVDADVSTLDLTFLLPSSESQSLGRIGSHDVLGVLGRGGMGIVFKAFDASLHRPVAIKVLAPELASSQTARRRFLREARAAAAINHPNVVTIHAVEEQRGLPYLVMEYIAGRSLRQRILASAPLDPAAVLRIAAQVAQGLAAAHAQGVIHRDIKPGNIMLEDSVERVKITDFGLARAAMDVSELTSLGRVVGTPAYMSAEQVSGDTLDSRSDLFSLGCVMYAMVAGHSPFHGAHSLEVIRKVCDYTPLPLHEFDPRVPRFLSDVVARLLQKDPKNRYQSAAEAAEALTRQLATANQVPSDSVTEIARPKVRPRHAQRRRLIAVALAAGGVVLALLTLLPRRFVQGPGDRLTSDGVPLSGVITVAQSGPASFRSIGEALQHAAPDAVVQVLDDATYTETVRIADGDRLRGVTLEATRGATLTARSSRSPVLSIVDTPDFVVRGFQIRAPAGQHAILIEGAVAGLNLDHVRCTQSPGTTSPALKLAHGAHGSAGHPIRIHDCVIDCSNDGNGIELNGDEAPVSFVYLQNNRFVGNDVHLLLWKSVRDTAITGNVFVRGMNGVNLNFELAGQAQRLTIANNTFFQTTYWLGLVFSQPDQSEVIICNNLIIGAKAVELSSQDLTEVARRWSFCDNWWQSGPETHSQARVVAEVQPNLSLLSVDPGSADFLRPGPDSPLASAGAGGALPRYVGAVAPAAPSHIQE